MNKLPQTPKSFDRFEGQDHGTRGNTLVREDESYREGHTNTNKEAKDKAYAEAVNYDFALGVDEYLDTLSPAQLETVANEILAEERYLSSEQFDEGTSRLVYDSEREKDIRDTEEKIAAADEQARYDEYERAQADIADISGMGEQLDVNTPARVRKEMARNAMLDPANDEDDHGDFPTQPVRRLN